MPPLAKVEMEVKMEMMFLVMVIAITAIAMAAVVVIEPTDALALVLELMMIIPPVIFAEHHIGWHRVVVGVQGLGRRYICRRDDGHGHDREAPKYKFVAEQLRKCKQFA